MRPKRFTYTLAALDADGYVASANVNSVAVGVGYTIRAAATHPGDGCSHPVTVASGGDTSGTVFTVTGLDAEGRTISEDITGPNNGTATSTKYFADVTAVVRKSGATGAVAFTVGYTALAHTPIYPVDRFSSGAVMAVDIGGTVTYSGTCTHGNVFELPADTLQFVNLIDMAALTADSSIGVAQDGATGMRAYVASHTAGTIAVTYSQRKG